MPKKPKKDEIISIAGEVGDITPTLIQVAGKNIATIGNVTVNKIKDMGIKKGDSVKITYQNGILLTIERSEQEKGENVHMEKETPEETAGNTAVQPDIVTPPPTEAVISPQHAGDIGALKDEIHMQFSAENLGKYLEGKNIEDICNIRDEMERLAKIALIKHEIKEFDKYRAEGAVISDIECVAVGGSFYDGEDERLKYGDRIEYKITLITPATDEEIAKYKGWEDERKRAEEAGNN